MCTYMGTVVGAHACVYVCVHVCTVDVEDGKRDVIILR